MPSPFVMPDWTSLHSVGRRAKRAVFEWFHALWLLGKRFVSTWWWVVVIVAIPFYSFVEEGPNTATMKVQAVGFISGLWGAARAAPGLAIAAAIAIGMPICRLLAKTKVPEIMNLHRVFMDSYEKFESGNLRNSTTLTEEQYDTVIKAVIMCLSELCTRVEASFKIITGSECCATIKSYN